MASLDHIRTRGFRRWYERQLIECHAWLVSCFLAIIGFASGIEVFGQHTAETRLWGGLLALAGVGTALFSWRRYSSMLAIAERLGERAVCPSCGAYSNFRVLDSGPKPMPDDGDADIEHLGASVWLRARCNKCQADWVL
jgi:hypothetical protein